LQRFGELIGARRFDEATDDLVVVEPEKLFSNWKNLKLKYPADFPSP
jgi:hypothetical protein